MAKSMDTMKLPRAQLKSMHFWQMFNAEMPQTAAAMQYVPATELQTASSPDAPSPPPPTPMVTCDTLAAPTQATMTIKQEVVGYDLLFRNEHLFLPKHQGARIIIFTRRFQFAHIVDASLRRNVSALTAFDTEQWEYEAGSFTFRLARLGVSDPSPL
jgi:hypothetical protein